MRSFHKTSPKAFLNFLLAKYEMYVGATRVLSRPYYLAIDPSSICQLRCPTCPTGLDSERKRLRVLDSSPYRPRRVKMDRSVFESLMDELGELAFLVIFYNWGEPLLNENLPAYIRATRDRGIETDINTNLSLKLSSAFVQDLIRSGLDNISISADGFSQEVYERYRVGGRIDLVKDNIRLLVETRRELRAATSIEWNYLVFKHNEHEIDAARAWCKDHGIGFNTRDAYIDNPEWLPSHRQGEEPSRLDPEWNRSTVWSPLREARQPSDSSRCGWHYGYSIINADGHVSPCCASWNQSEDFGQVSGVGSRFSEVWNSDLVRAVRSSFAGTSQDANVDATHLCMRCPYGTQLQHLYSLFDLNVVSRFYATIGSSDRLLHRAFNLYVRARYGRLAETALRSGLQTQLYLTIPGNESEANMGNWAKVFHSEVLARAQDQLGQGTVAGRGS